MNLKIHPGYKDCKFISELQRPGILFLNSWFPVNTSVCFRCQAEPAWLFQDRPVEVRLLSLSKYGYWLVEVWLLSLSKYGY
jgi:hypothetical protein